MNTSTTTDQQDIADYLGSASPRKWWQKRWLWALAALILAAIVYFAFFATEEAGPDYITAEVEQRSLDLSVAATGNLRPTNQVQVGSEVSGRIDRVLVDVNDRVARGQVLAIINTDVIRDQIIQSRASLIAARAAVAQARASLEVDTAQLERLREVYRLSDGRVPSRTEMEQAEGALRRSQAALASAQANVTSADASLSTSQTQSERAVIRSPVAGVVLARQVEPGQTVVASFNTPTLFVLAEDLSVMQLRVAIDEADVGQVEAGQQASFAVDAYPGRRFPAVVERVDLASTNTATADQTAAGQSNAVVEYEARLRVRNPEGLLRPGMTATASIATASTGTRLLVPNSALRFDPDALDEEEEDTGGPGGPPIDIGLDRMGPQATIGVGSRQTVQVLQDDGTLRAIAVTTGQSDGRQTAVTSEELQPGMRVVTGVRAAAP